MNGFVVLWPSPDWRGASERRQTKTKTLNGGVYINDLGFSEADSDFDFTLPNTPIEDVEIMVMLAKNFSSLFLATEDGLFEGGIKRHSLKSVPTFTFSILRKIST